jgi:hypothetical protein
VEGEDCQRQFESRSRRVAGGKPSGEAGSTVLLKTRTGDIYRGTLIITYNIFGEVTEWFMVLVLKTSVGQPTVGSNPTFSAKIIY